MSPLQPGKYLARRAITVNGIQPLTLIDLNADGYYTLTPFERETAATAWLNADVAMLKPGVLSEYLIDDLAAMSRMADPLVQIQNYLAASGLLAKDDEPTTPVTLDFD